MIVLRTPILLIADQVSRVFEFQPTIAFKFNIELKQKSKLLDGLFRLWGELINKSHTQIDRNTNTRYKDGCRGAGERRGNTMQRINQ
jgi:hypothetical protein